MFNIPSLTTITTFVPQASANLSKIIAAKRIFKTKLKLLQIAYLDEELENLLKHNLGFPSLSLEDFYLTESYSLILPKRNEIIAEPNIICLKLKSYLIYLSYLYNVDLLSLFYHNKKELLNIIQKLNLPSNIKDNILSLINFCDAESFNHSIDSLNNVFARNKIEEDKLYLARKLNVN